MEDHPEYESEKNKYIKKKRIQRIVLIIALAILLLTMLFQTRF